MSALPEGHVFSPPNYARDKAGDAQFFKSKWFRGGSSWSPSADSETFLSFADSLRARRMLSANLSSDEAMIARGRVSAYNRAE